LSGGDGRAERWIVLPASRDQFYFLSHDGELRRGDDFASAEPLQDGFLTAMARIGGMNSEVEPKS
jgi:hypothetical protein